MTLFECLLLGFLVVCAISVSFSKNLLNSILIYMSYSLIMSIIWICLESPDLGITEAAVGAGVTSVLFFVTLKKIHAIRQDRDGNDITGTLEQAPATGNPVHEAAAANEAVKGTGTAAADRTKRDGKCAESGTPCAEPAGAEGTNQQEPGKEDRDE